MARQDALKDRWIGTIRSTGARLRILKQPETDLRFEEQMALVVRWPILFLIVAIATKATYRFGPSREPANIRWLTWGAVVVTMCWFLISPGFSFYLDHFANYDATYGTFGANPYRGRRIERGTRTPDVKGYDNRFTTAFGCPRRLFADTLLETVD